MNGEYEKMIFDILDALEGGASISEIDKKEIERLGRRNPLHGWTRTERETIQRIHEEVVR